MKGKFISLEGGEGSGKSTAIECIEQWLVLENLNYVMTREPGGTDLAEEIRDLILQPRVEDVDNMTELLLVFAARAQHLSQKIRPALKQGLWVVSDRFIDSAFVYQGKARGGKIEMLHTLTEWVVGVDQPDATLLLDVPVNIGLNRVALRQHSNRLDRESMQLHENVRQSFLDRAALEPERIKIINADQSIGRVHTQIIEALNTLKSDWVRSI